MYKGCFWDPVQFNGYGFVMCGQASSADSLEDGAHRGGGGGGGGARDRALGRPQTVLLLYWGTLCGPSPEMGGQSLGRCARQRTSQQGRKITCMVQQKWELLSPGT